ncbi:MAG TPA: ATP-binding cassette domain-containing protein [Candidatus Ozemobacteraceae bacterium]|nr:ATP-binding cassette domain-containing protein [Candidatus Ozemobacteraceae bacterium]
MIVVRDLCVRAGGFSMPGLDLDVKRGEYFVLLGPSGAGKTVLIETLLGLHPIVSGKISFDGVDVTALPPEERRVGYIPQDYGLFPHLGVRDNILFGARAQGMDASAAGQRLSEIVALLDIESLIPRLDVRSLSGGERQRVAIARALLVNPRALFLDEPFSAIDEYLRRQLLRKLVQIRDTLGVTIIHVTHDHHEAYFLGDRIGVVLQGRLHQVGTRDDLYHRPQTIEVARFLLTRNLYSGVACDSIGDGEVEVACGEMRFRARADRPVTAGTHVWWGIRPEEIRIEPKPTDWNVCDSGECNAIPGVIRARRESFLSYQFEVDAGGLMPMLEIEMVKTASCARELVEGAEVKLCLRRKALWVLPKI